nr:hypothetical protein [Nocardioides humi]
MVEDQPVEAAEGLDRLVHDPGDPGRLADVGDHHVCAGLLGDGAQRRLPATADDDPVAGRGELPGDRGADAGAAAGDEDDLPRGAGHQLVATSSRK